jgi:hypothetical protein
VACINSKGEIYRKTDMHAVDWRILGFYHGLINYIVTKAKCRHLKKLTYKGTLQQVFIEVNRLATHSGMLSTQLCELLPL